MEPITLSTVAIGLATHYLFKTGEKIAESVGEDVWKFIKKNFGVKESVFLEADFKEPKNLNKVVDILCEKIIADEKFKDDLQKTVEKAQAAISTKNEQKIINNGNVEKQINIQNNKGNIEM